MAETHEQQLAILADAMRPPQERFAAARELGRTGDPALIPALQKFLKRPRPEPEEEEDPTAVERACDILVVGALHELGDDTQWPYLLDAISQASSGFAQPFQESDLAAEAIQMIGSTKLLGEVFARVGGENRQASLNAIRTLIAMQLPQPATHQSLEGQEALARSFQMRPRMLSGYVNRMVEVAAGRLVLSPGVRQAIDSNDYQVAEGDEETLSPAEFLTEEAPLYGFTYYLEDGRATLCTWSEAAARWKDWWDRHAATLAWDKTTSRFRLNPR